jgi:pimeloyl-ACP methyl ester carboxylesterase
MFTPDVSYMVGNNEPREFFCVTPEGLNIEFLASSVGSTRNKPPSPSIGERISKFISRTLRRPQPAEDKKKPPIFFIHGSFHAAWCFAENYFDYFSALGHTCYAISLRGTSNTGMPPNDPGETVKIEQHVSDVKYALSVVRAMDGNEDLPDPVLVAHSFGGVVAMKLLEDEEVRGSLSGVCWLCSVPPSGNGPMTGRFIRARFCSALKIVWGFVFKAATFDPTLCRELFFDESVPEEDLLRYYSE